jgi:DNA helicase INO80
MHTGTAFEDEFENMTARSNGQDYDHRRFNSSAEDAALEFERAMLQESPVPKSKRKNADAKKRPIPNPDSDLEGNVDKIRGDVPGPSVKRRKLDNDAANITNGIDHQPPQESISLRLSISKLKGKAKQAQREPSHDSISTTPKVRKKPGPKKKIGVALELESEQASRPSSLMGDVTPAVSRPNSPAPTNTTMVYELDEQIPPMKKAKKIDDNAMIKRIKSLEEAQRKVWTNIARRDVAKVC